MFLPFCNITNIGNDCQKEGLGCVSASMRTQVQHSCKNLSITECSTTPSCMSGDSRSLEHCVIHLDRTLSFWFYEELCLKGIMWSSRQEDTQSPALSFTCICTGAYTHTHVHAVLTHIHNIILHVSSDLHPWSNKGKSFHCCINHCEVAMKVLTKF